MIILLIAAAVMIAAYYYVSPIRHGHVWAYWGPKTIQGRLLYVGLSCVGIVVMVVTMRLISGHWG